jgi:hypothetical protein
MSDYKQLTIDHSRPGLWTITFSNPPINMFVPTPMATSNSSTCGHPKIPHLT